MNAVNTASYEVTNDVVLVLEGQLQGISFETEVYERDVIDAIGRFEHPEVGIISLLKIGACATLATGTGYDINAVRKEIDRLVGDTNAAVTTLRTHVFETMGENGPLAAALSKTCIELDAAVREILESEVDPEDPNSLLARMHGVTKHYGELLEATRKNISESFEKSSDRHAERIDRALREMRDLDPASAIGQAFRRLEGELGILRSAVAATQAAAHERQRGTAKGDDYEDLVAEEVAEIASVFGDRAEHTGKQPGRLIQKKAPSMRGDVTCMINNTPAIVLEAMDRGKSELTHKLVVPELNEAIENRAAVAAIAVVSSTDNRLMLGQPLQMLGQNLWAVVLDKDTPNPLALQVAYRLARAVATTSTSTTKVVDFEALKADVEEINEKLNGLGEVKTQLNNIARSGDEALKVIMRVERETRLAIAALLDTLEAEAAEAAESDEQAEAA